MTHRSALLLLLFLTLVISGCSSDNASAPTDKEAHPLGWIKTHSADALAAGSSACSSCHGTDLRGSAGVVSCYSCHSYNTTPPLTIHPVEWTDPYASHRSYATVNGFASCAQCHGVDLYGSPAAPSCFTADFDGRRCHDAGPGQVPHPLDGSYLKGANHGPDAKADLTICQNCHGQSGGPGSNPRFNIGIDSVSATGCEGCHGVNSAHPADWAGPNATFHYSAGSIQKSCTLCHGVKLDGGNGAVGVSCGDCHNSTSTFTLDCASCHGNPPEGSASVAAPLGVDHGNAATIAGHDRCVVCHGMKESASGGGFAVTSNYRLFDKSTDTPGNHWDGRIDMNATPGYDQTSFGCSTALCHGNDSAHQLSDSGLPVALVPFGLGDAIPHSLDGTFLDPLYHGPAAKGLTAAFPNGIADCQPCHAESGTSSPRFNVGINRVGGKGCESCHNDGTAHPTVGSRDSVHWYDSTFVHSDVRGFTACTLCHGAGLGGVTGSGPACTDCHAADPVVNSSGCVSCHGLPPNGGDPVGELRPNRRGGHSRAGHGILISAIADQTCGRCHNGAGVGTAAHFDTSSPADVNFFHPDPSDTMTAVSTDTNTTCNGACHITIDKYDIVYPHTNKSWYP
jgi:hypothetical protein